MFGNFKKVVMNHATQNADGFWTTMPIQVSTSTGARYFLNARKAAAWLGISEQALVEDLFHRTNVYDASIDERIVQRLVGLEKI